VPIAKLTSNQDMLLSIAELSFKAGSDFTARTQQMETDIQLDKSELIFVG
jgi:hypothetical protein